MSGLESVVSSLLVWIAANSGYDTAEIQHPDIQVVTPEEITAEYYSDMLAYMPDSGVDPRIKALYAPNDGTGGTIYLRLTEDIADIQENIEAQEVLLHELVHHVQWQTGAPTRWKCTNEGELEAYMLGAEYLRQHSNQDYLFSRRTWAQIYSEC